MVNVVTNEMKARTLINLVWTRRKFSQVLHGENQSLCHHLQHDVLHRATQKHRMVMTE